MFVRRLALTTAVALAVGTTALAQQQTSTVPFERSDDSWITVSGEVVRSATDRFTLDYGDGTVIVEMDSPTGRDSGYALRAGDKVTVTGVVDDDMFETASIEASSVFVESLGKHFFSSAVDEEDVALAVVTPVVISRTAIVGTVSEVSGNEMTVNTGQRSVRVDLSQLSSERRDLQKGDRVSVVGTIDRDFFEGRELMATALVELSPLGPGARRGQVAVATDGDGQMGDSWIEERVWTMIDTTRGIDGARIKVQASDGHVTLSGHVDDARDRQRAISLAEQVRGVRSVDARSLSAVDTGLASSDDEVVSDDDY